MPDWFNNIIEEIKNLNSTVTEYKKETVIQSLPALAYVNRAKKKLQEGKLNAAKKILSKALELPQKDPLVYKYLGIVNDKLKDYTAAADAYQESANLNPHDKNVWQKLGFALVACNKYTEAAKSFENANKIVPGDTDTYTGWGMALMKSNKYSDAFEKFTEAIKASKYNFTAIFLAAVMNVKMKEYDKAEAKLSFLANICPNESNTYELASLKFIKCDYENAIYYGKKAVEYNSNMLPAYILLGKIYTALNNMDSASKAFQTAENKELISSNLYIEWAISQAKFGNLAEAKNKLFKALDADPENTEVMAYIGFYSVNEGNMDEAKKYIEKAMEKEPENIIVKQSLGIISFKEEDNDKAMILLKETLDDDRDDSINYYYLAKIYEKQNNHTKIKENYEMAISKNPKYIKAYIDYVKYFISENNFQEARRKLRKALKADEKNIDILNLLFLSEYMLVKDNGCEYNIKEALAIAKKIEEISPDLFEYTEKKEKLAEILNNKS